MKKKIVLLIIFLGLGIFFVWFSIKDFKPEDVQHIQESAEKVLNPKSLVFIFISIIFAVSAHYFRTLRNILLIDPLGYRVRKTTAFYSVMVCYLANLAIPRLGEVLRCTFLQRYDKVPVQKSFGTIVVERVFDLLVFILLLVIVIFLNKGLLSGLVINKEGITLGNWIDEKWIWLWSMKYLVLAALIVGFMMLFFVRKYKKRKQETIKKQSQIVVKIKNIISGLWQGLISVKDLQHPYLFIIYTIAIWVCYYLGGYFCFFAFDFLKALGDQMPMAALVVLAVGSIGFMIAQGGLGAYPLIVTGVLMLYGVESRDGFTAGWIGWSAQTIMILVVGFTTLILSSFLKVEDRAVKTSNDSLTSSVSKT